MKKLSAVALLVLALAVPGHTQDEPVGTQATIIAEHFDCGRAAAGVNCFGVPVTINGQSVGTISLKLSMITRTGTIFMSTSTDLGDAMVTDVKLTAGYVSRPGTVTIIFSGHTNDGDGDAYTGTGTFSFTYPPTGGGGRYTQFAQVLQSGSMEVTWVKTGAV